MHIIDGHLSLLMSHNNKFDQLAATFMGEFDEFAEALFGQMEVELNEEKEIARLADIVSDDPAFDVKFTDTETLCSELLSEYAPQASKLFGISYDTDTHLRCLSLEQFKRMKAQKVFCNPESREFVDRLFAIVASNNLNDIAEIIRSDPARYIVYSMYVIQYISRLTTTYGDYSDGTIFINDFILSRYPKIILYNMGAPYHANANMVRSGYRGAVKMTILEESIHSMQERLVKTSSQSAMGINNVNENLAGIILDMDDDTIRYLSNYLQLQPVPDDFPFARKANLYFYLNPDRFLHEQGGDSLMVRSSVDLDSKISEHIPTLPSLYEEWLVNAKKHYAITVLRDGMAGFAIKNILGRDPDFEWYLKMFAQTDADTYHAQRREGIAFVEYVHQELGQKGFDTLMSDPPTIQQIRDPATYA